MPDSESNTATGRVERSPADRVPACATLTGFAVQPGCLDGLALRSLAPGTSLSVMTLNSEYRFVVLEAGAEDNVQVTGGRFFPTPAPARLVGATAGGSLIKTGWIGVGLQMEIVVEGRRIVTSPVRSAAIVGVPVPTSAFQRPA